jgi:tRNA-dihydrouridine synthase C
VNRHGGGAVLINAPERVHAIARAVRAALPETMMLTAKMRLGVADTSRALDCARALAEGGIAELVVHARTRDEAYRPPAHWEWIGRIGEAVRTPVIANGEVWTVADWARCRAESGVADVMLGRGAVADPFLARRIRAGDASGGDDDVARAAEWRELCPVIAGFRHHVMGKVKPMHAPGRLKQWFNLLRRRYPEAEAIYQRIRSVSAMTAIDGILTAAGIAAGEANRVPGCGSGEQVTQMSYTDRLHK